MRLSHKLSDNHKVVNSQHAGGPVSGAAALMHGPATPAGPGPAPVAPPQTPPGAAAFSNGGCYADGGEPDGTEKPSYWDAVKDRVGELVGSPKTPAASEPKHTGEPINAIIDRLSK